MVLLGHTLDDQAETVLLGLARGSGLRSLAGMPTARDGFVRPLLGLRREVTRRSCLEQNVTWWDDPHNQQTRFSRVRVRQSVLPVLEAELGPGVAEALGRAFAALNETEAAIALFEAALHHDAAPSLQLVEQLATLRLRAAVAPRADGSFAPDAAQRIGAIRADIEALCRIAGDTVERLTLIGATYKREALLQSGAKVDATLAVMRDCYRRAWQLARERGDANAYYPGQLVVEAGLLIDLRAGHPASAATKADLAQLAADLAQGEEQLDDYWHAASRAGYLLFGELAAGTLSAAAHTAIVHCYDKVMLRCGSNFEFETTLADMRYMRAQLGNGHGAAAAAWIASIEEAIARLES